MTLFIKDLVSIGAVDSGDNPESEIVFWKRRKAKPTPARGEEKGNRMIEGFDLTGLAPETAEALSTAFEVLKAERDAALEAVPVAEPVEKALDADTLELVAKFKADLAAKDKELAVEVAKRRDAEMVAKIKDDGLVPLLGAAEQVAPNLRALEAGAPEAFAAVYGNLVAAAQRTDFAKALGELGNAEPEGPQSYQDRRDAYVAKRIAENPDLTADQATIIKLRSEFVVLHPEAVAESRESK